MICTVTRRYRFSAAHRLHSAALSDEVNAAIYGKCNHPYGHGHDYVLDVRVRGAIDAATGSVIDVARLDDYVRRHVVGVYQGKYFNAEVAGFESTVPTAENIALDAEARLRRYWRDEFPERALELAGVRLEETKRNTVEIGAGAERV